jgi:hypothetical protein
LFSFQAPDGNGDPISKFYLEWDQGIPHGGFQEVYTGPETQFKLSAKLEPGRRYQFRLKASNGVGQSEYSEVLPYNSGIAAPPKSPPPNMKEVGVDFIHLSWGGSESCDSHMTSNIRFKLEMEDPESGHGFRIIYQGDNKEWKQDSLLRNHLYRFQLSMVNEKGTGSHSNPIDVSTLPDTPGTPGSPRLLTHIKRREIALIWDPPSDDGGSPVTSYHLEMACNEKKFVCVYKGVESQYLCEGLTPGANYDFRVRAASEGGMGCWSAVSRFTTTSQPPSQPLALQVSGKSHQHKISLKWGKYIFFLEISLFSYLAFLLDLPTSDGGAPIIHYTVECCSADGSDAWSVGGVVPAGAFRLSADTPTQFSYTVDHLVPGQAYQFRVGCSNSSGSSPWSKVVVVTTAPGVPGPPLITGSRMKNPSSAVISLEPPPTYGSDILHYVIRYWTAEGKEQWKEMTSEQPSCQLKALSPAHEYHYKVSAVNGVGMGVWSSVESLETLPSSPGQVSGVSAVSNLPSEVTVSWVPPQTNGSPILKYRIESQTGTLDVDGTSTSHTLHGLSPGTQYKVRVQAINAVGAGPPSAYVSARTLPPPPDPPILTQLSATPTSLKITWDKKLKKVPSITFHLEMITDNKSEVIYTGSDTSHKISRLAPNKKYSFRVSAANVSGKGNWGPITTFATPPLPPGAPTEFTVNVVSSGQVRFSWSDVTTSSTLYYEVQRRILAGDTAYQQVYAGSATTCSMECNCGERYEARLRAVVKDPLLYGKFTDPVQFEIPESKLDHPSSTEDTPPAQEIVEKERQKLLDSLAPYSVHILFIFLSTVIVLLAFVLGYCFDF